MSDILADRRYGHPASDQPVSRLSKLLPAVCLYWLVAVVVSLAFTLPGAKDLIGPDNDDAMRLVEVRDLLAGQGWFDLMQYRLGLAGGTLMHWSRFVDLPIALLVRFYQLFLQTGAAEGAAAVTWPLLLAGLLLYPLGLAGRRMGGVATMHIALGLGVIFLFTCGKFRPGAIDHHNIQLALSMWIAAMLIDRRARASSLAIAGLAAALAIAIGAETVPFVAIACLCVAGQWLWQGDDYATPARAFGLSLALAISAAFFATVPPHAYAVVTCDNLSLGFYALTTVGGAGLFLAASMPGLHTRLRRAGAALVVGGAVLVAAKVIAPQCLGNPLANLDPLLVELWLNGVSEARSIVSEVRYSPETVGSFYAVGFYAMLVCLFRIRFRQDTLLHVQLFVLIAAVWAVSLLQVRGSFFANLLAILPLSLLIADLRRAARANPESAAVGLAFILGVLASVPAIWGVCGILCKQGLNAIDMQSLAGTGAAEPGSCDGPASMALLNTLPPGVIAAPSNSGASILRFTPHRALSAPYHRNQGGMLTELHIGLSTASDAGAFLRGAGVTALAFCRTDPQTEAMIKLKKDGLYADLARGAVPAYLAPMNQEPVDGFRIYRVIGD